MNVNNNHNANLDKDPYYSPMKSDNATSFDIVLWLFRILKYWYLFVISILICMGVAFLKNKTWVAEYSIQALVMLEPRGSQGVVGSVPLGAVLSNTVNQQIILDSYGMTERTVKSLPSKMRVDYFRQTPFKRFSLYTVTPIKIEIEELGANVYGRSFNIAPIDEDKCRIYYDTDSKNGLDGFSMEARYGQSVVNDQFRIRLEKTRAYEPDFLPFSFTFLSESQLLNMYHYRVQTALKEETGSAILLSMGGTDPYRDIDYLNTLLSEFESYNLNLKNSQADLTIAFLEKQLVIISDSLQSSRLALDHFQRKTGVYEVTSSSFLREDLVEADKEKRDVAILERSILVFSEKVAESIMGDSKIVEPKELGIEQSSLNSLVQSYNIAIDNAKYMGPKSPLFDKTVRELNKLRTDILRELKRAQLALQDQKDLLIEKYRLLDLKIDNLPPQERDLVKLERDYQINEIYHQFLTQRKYEAQIQRASNTPDNFVWEYPRISSGPNNAGSKSKAYMFWMMIGFAIPLIYVILKEEIFNHTIATKEECEKLTGLPVLGAIENVSAKLKGGVALIRNYPKSSFAEAFRNIRVRIEYMAQKDHNISVLVTSAEPGDGKTLIATNIASAYQMMNKKVVIIDLDLRRPSVAKTLKIPDSLRGVSNYLIGQVGLDEIIIKNSDYGFDIIPAGTLPPNPSELIKTEKTKELLKILQEKYDYVVVDCSPVGLVSDAYVLAPLVDTTLFAVRRGKTNKSFFKSVIGQLKADNIENIALIFNDVKGREGFYGTSRYYGDRTYYLRKNSYYHDDYFEG